MAHEGGGHLSGGGAEDLRVGDRGTAAVVTSSTDGIAVLEVTGAFPAAAATANEALLRALFREPRAVVCDVSAVTGSLDARTLGQLLDTDGYLEHWQGTRLALIPGDLDPAALPESALPAGVLIEESFTEAVRALADLEASRTASLQLAAHPRAGRAARDFVSRTCLDWRLPHGIPSAVLIVSELVTNAISHAGTDVDVSLAALANRLRLSVQDGNDDPPRLVRRTGAELGRGRGMHVVEGFSRAWGTLPGPEGGKAVWAVIDA